MDLPKFSWNTAGKRTSLLVLLLCVFLAAEVLRLAIAAEPANANHYLDLSTVLNDSGRRESALRVLSDGLEKSVQRDRLQVQIGLLSEGSGDNDEAEKWYRRSLAAAPNAPAYLALAHVLSATGRGEQVQSVLEDAIRLLPDDFLIYFMCGAQMVIAAQDREPDAALERAGLFLKKAAEMNPLYADTFYWLGKYFLKAADQESARKSFERACALNPRHASAYHQLMRLAVASGDRLRAEELSRTLKTLQDADRRQDQETVTGLVQESLRETANAPRFSPPKPP